MSSSRLSKQMCHKIAGLVESGSIGRSLVLSKYTVSRALLLDSFHNGRSDIRILRFRALNTL